MASPLRLNLPDSEKLAALQRFDGFRNWHSLDDQRYCLGCGRIINGRQIQLIENMEETEPLRVGCPTKDCKSIPMDWVLPTDEVLSKGVAREEHLEVSGREFQRPERSIAARLRRVLRV